MAKILLVLLWPAVIAVIFGVAALLASHSRPEAAVCGTAGPVTPPAASGPFAVAGGGAHALVRG
jgi:hypothetical protein